MSNVGASFRFKTLRADQERFQRDGLNPGEAYIGLWRICHDYLEMMNALRKKLASNFPAQNRRMLARHDLLLWQMKDTLRQIIPYERPKLAAIEVAGDQINPHRVKPDLTKLTDAEWISLKRSS
jgi:hypothetical protein